MSLNRQTVLRGFPRCQLTDMFQQEAAGSGRESASAAADIMSGRRYRLVTSGELVEETVPDSTSRISVPYNWQLQEYQPSTVINVKKVEDQSSPASCTNSTSVRISSHQQHDGDIHPRSNTFHTIRFHIQCSLPASCSILQLIRQQWVDKQKESSTACKSLHYRNR